jgi:hypothetical protein
MDQPQILDADLSCRLSNVCYLLVAMCMWMKALEDRHGDVFGG